MSDDPAKHEPDQNGVVELSRDRNKVRDQVEWQREVRYERGYEELVSSGQPPLSQQPRKQDDTVGDEPRDYSRIPPLSGDDEHEYEKCVHEERRAERDEKPDPHAGAKTSSY